MLKYFIWTMRFLIIGIIYFLLYKIIRTMYTDLKAKQLNPSKPIEYGIEVLDAPTDTGIEIGHVYPVHTITSIGRKDDNNIIIDDQFVSSKHANIILKESKLFIQDLNSTNGVIVNGVKVSDLTEIFEGDRIEIGRAMFTILN